MNIDLSPMHRLLNAERGKHSTSVQSIERFKVTLRIVCKHFGLNICRPSNPSTRIGRCVVDQTVKNPTGYYCLDSSSRHEASCMIAAESAGKGNRILSLVALTSL